MNLSRRGFIFGAAAVAAAAAVPKVAAALAPQRISLSEDAHFYISPDGNDEWEGTYERPWRTPENVALIDANGRVVTIEFAEGVYEGPLICSSSDGLWMIHGAGGDKTFILACQRTVFHPPAEYAIAVLSPNAILWVDNTVTVDASPDGGSLWYFRNPSIWRRSPYFAPAV